MALKTEIVPDKTLTNKRSPYYSDRLEITIYKNKIVFNARVDNTGNTFEISKKELRELIGRV